MTEENHTRTYIIIAIVILFIASITESIFQPEHLIQVIGFATTTIAALLAWGQSRDTHKAVNGRLDAIIEAAAEKKRRQLAGTVEPEQEE